MTLDEKLQACVKGCRWIRVSLIRKTDPFGLAFRAGAAAMTELFASGQGLKVEHLSAPEREDYVGLSVYHSPDCPVAQPNFVPDPNRNQCTCDFMKRLKQALGTPI